MKTLIRFVFTLMLLSLSLVSCDTYKTNTVRDGYTDTHLYVPNEVWLQAIDEKPVNKGLSAGLKTHYAFEAGSHTLRLCFMASRLKQKPVSVIQYSFGRYKSYDLKFKRAYDKSANVLGLKVPVENVEYEIVERK